MPNSAVHCSTAIVTRIPKQSVLLNLCKMHQKTNCGVILEPESKDPIKRGTRMCCHKDYEKLRRMANGDEKKWRMFELLGWCAPTIQAITKQMYAELAAFEKQVVT